MLRVSSFCLDSQRLLGKRIMRSGYPFSIRDVLTIAIYTCLFFRRCKWYQHDVRVCLQQSACVGMDVLTDSLSIDQYALLC